MSGQPAARLSDMHTCPMIDPGPKPHVGGPILPVCAGSVLIGGLPAARVSDKLVCIGPPDTIVKGSFVVPISGKPAARMTDSTAHGGVIVAGCPTVLIGLAGVAGDVFSGTILLNDTKSGRVSGSSQQTYENCGTEAIRQIVNYATKVDISEDDLLQDAINSRLAVGVPGNPPGPNDGGTTPETRQVILEDNGVSSCIQLSTDENLSNALCEGKGVIASIDASYIWGLGTPPRSYHAVLVTGIEYDDTGTMISVFINDTGTGEAAKKIPAVQFRSAIAGHSRSRLNVTENELFE